MIEVLVPYLIGGLGVAIGVIVALYYLNKYTKAKGQLDLLTSDHEALKENNTKLAADHTKQVAGMEAELAGLRAREAKTRDEVRELLVQCNDPVVLNDELNRLFPVPKEVPDVPPVP